MGLQTYDGRDVRIQQASRSHADVLQLSGTAVCAGGTSPASVQDEPYTVHQVRTSFIISLCIICIHCVAFIYIVPQTMLLYPNKIIQRITISFPHNALVSIYYWTYKLYFRHMYVIFECKVFTVCVVWCACRFGLKPLCVGDWATTLLSAGRRDDVVQRNSRGDQMM